MDARRRHMDLCEGILNKEQAELLQGRGTVADVAEAAQAYEEAKFDMKLGAKEDAEKASFLRRIDELERKVEQLEKKRAGG